MDEHCQLRDLIQTQDIRAVARFYVFNSPIAQKNGSETLSLLKAVFNFWCCSKENRSGKTKSMLLSDQEYLIFPVCCLRPRSSACFTSTIILVLAKVFLSLFRGVYKPTVTICASDVVSSKYLIIPTIMAALDVAAASGHHGKRTVAEVPQ